MLSQSTIWEADTKELEILLQEVQKELRFRAICEDRPLDTPLAEAYGG